MRMRERLRRLLRTLLRRGRFGILEWVPRGHFSTNRGLDSFARLFGPRAITSAIEQRQHAGPPVRVLEIGCGEGRALLELRKLFPDAELHGVNKDPWRVMRGTKSLQKTAKFHGLFTDAELRRIALPKIHFCDARALPFEDAVFDLVISQTALHYVDRKDTALEEVWRVLAPGGEAFLHIDSWRPELPDFLDHATPRLTIYRQHQRVPFQDHIARFASAGYDLRLETNGQRSISVSLLMRRNISEALRLGLTFDEMASFDMNPLNKERPRWDVYWGYRSVFRLDD